MKEKKKVYEIQLFMPGNDIPIAFYHGCQGYRTKPDHGTVVITRSDGNEVETDMYFRATSKEVEAE